MKIQISPSILSADYGNLEPELRRITAAGADMVHIDVMDGHFVPNITLGAPIVKCIRHATDLPFDVHLMISDPQKYIPDFLKAGADSITFHIESDGDAAETIDLILKAGKKAAIAVKPATPIEAVYPYLDKLSMVLVMTVEPGFGGQSFMEDMMPKIVALRQECARRGIENMDVQVDGGIGAKTIAVAAKAGANVFVSGNALFSSADMQKTIAEFKALCR
ncbi:MAG: ribulose-phosphate 3-epimerase [Clostridia bacterium]|nr:ribulose-phosphate 3-epimerase [Clostridia bacterium]